MADGTVAFRGRSTITATGTKEVGGANKRALCHARKHPGPRARTRTHAFPQTRTHARTAHSSYSVHPRYAQAGNGAVAWMSGGTLLLDDTVISNTAATSVRSYPWRWRAVRWCVHGLLRKHLRPAALPCTTVGGGCRLQRWCRLFCRSRRCPPAGVPSSSRTRASASRCAVHE